MKKNYTRTRFAAVLAAMGMLVMSSGVALMVAAPASADPISQPNPNHEDHWETLPGEVCVKTDSSSETGGVLVPAENEGFDWSKLIIKKGSGNIGVENQVFNNPVAGQTYTWVGFEPQQTGGWSHYILCQVPEVEPELIEVDVVFTEPTCENANEASFAVTGDTDHVTVETSTPAVPGANVTVTVTADAGFEFAGGETEYVESHQFAVAETPCEDVTPPNPPEVTPGSQTPPTVVHAGVVESASDLGQQGLILFAVGLLILAAGAGLGLVRPGRQTA